MTRESRIGDGSLLLSLARSNYEEGAAPLGRKQRKGAAGPSVRPFVHPSRASGSCQLGGMLAAAAGTESND